MLPFRLTHTSCSEGNVQMYLFCGKWDQLLHQEVIRIKWLFKQQLIQWDYTANVANLDLLCSHLAHTNVCKPIT